MIGAELSSMRAFRKTGFRRRLSAIVAAALALGLLHGPSMMLAEAAPASVDCHAGAAKYSAVNSHAPGHGHVAADANDEVAADDIAGTGAISSACPLANITAIASPALAATLFGRATRMIAAEPTPLVSANLDRPDPPPRPAA
jgi:hypothetical protein